MSGGSSKTSRPMSWWLTPRKRSIPALSAGEWADVMTAIGELARARLARDRAMPTLAAPVDPLPPADPDQHRSCVRVGRALARGARIVPWQATCLVQAIAARHWLDRLGIPSAVSIGVRKDGERAIAAHAWVKAGGIIVVGGDVSGYAALAR